MRHFCAKSSSPFLYCIFNVGGEKKTTAVVSKNSKSCHKNMYVNLVEEFDKETIVLFFFPQMWYYVDIFPFVLSSKYWNPIKHLSKHSRMWKASVSCWKKMSSSCLSQCLTRTLFFWPKNSLVLLRLWSLLCQKFNLFQHHINLFKRIEYKIDFKLG